MKYDGYMDKECIPLCDALNKLPGVRTFTSCCGHLQRNFAIWFYTDNLYSIGVIARASDRRYVTTNVLWEIKIETIDVERTPQFCIGIYSTKVHRSYDDMSYDVNQLVDSIEYWSKPEFYDHFKYKKYGKSKRTTCTYIEKAPEIPIEVFQTTEIKGCQALTNAPKVSEDVIKATSVTSKDIVEAYYAIQKQRIEDNKSWFERRIDRLRARIKHMFI